jgi:surface polysaccharide O-acyltransferase-like enzyme
MLSVKKEEQYLNVLRASRHQSCHTAALHSPVHNRQGLIRNKNLVGLQHSRRLRPHGRSPVFCHQRLSAAERRQDAGHQSFYKRRLLKILPPFLVWDIVYFIAGRTASGLSLDAGVFFSELLVQGSKYHLWYVYEITGLYLLAPFLKRITDACDLKESSWFLLVILLPTTFFRLVNVVAPFYGYIFNSVVEGYAGYFVMGYILGHYPQSRAFRRAVYACGVLALICGATGNYLKSSPAEINMVFNEGYSVTQYATSAAAFLLAKNGPSLSRPAVARFFSSYSKLTYGIYLSHVLVLSAFSRLAAGLPAALAVPLGFAAASSVSAAAMYAVSKTRYLRRLLM